MQVARGNKSRLMGQGGGCFLLNQPFFFPNQGIRRERGQGTEYIDIFNCLHRDTFMQGFGLGGLDCIIYKMVALRSTLLIPEVAVPEDFVQLFRHLQAEGDRANKGQKGNLFWLSSLTFFCLLVGQELR